MNQLSLAQKKIIWAGVACLALLTIHANWDSPPKADVAQAKVHEDVRPAKVIRPAPVPRFDPVGDTVYITNTGRKYHSAGCGYLRKSSITISREEAIRRGHTPCSRCNP